MRVVLIEDEVPALAQLEAMVGRVAPEAVVVARLRSVRQVERWLAEDGVADVIVSDIQLGDGLALEAFEAVSRDIPVVFTTAYDHHLAPALAGNGIAYLLKPVQEEQLAGALAKLRRLERHFTGGLAGLARALQSGSAPAGRLVGRRGRDWVGVGHDEVAWARIEHGMTLVTTTDGQELLVDDSLQALQDALGASRFFRANRWTLVGLDAVERVKRAGKGRLELILDPPSPRSVEVSQETASGFRAWFGIDT